MTDGEELEIRKYIDELNIHSHFITIMDAQNKPTYYYVDGIYKPWGDRWAENLLSIIYPNLKSPVINAVVERIKKETFKLRNVFDADIMKIHLLNGILNLKTKKLEEFSPEIPAIVQIPVKYDPNAKCPNIDKFLHEVLKQEDINVIYELFGYCLLRNYSIKKLILLIGGNDSGKGTFLRLLNTFLGLENVSAVSLQSLNKDRFSKYDLVGKLANTMGDLPTIQLKNTGLIKSLTGDDLMDAEEKFGGRIKFTNYAKMIFATNTMPIIPDDELDSFINRFQFIVFPNEIPESEQDSNLINKLTSSEELSGLLNKAILGLIQIHGKTNFSNKMTKEELLNFYETFGSTEVKFISDCMEPEIGQYIIKDELYKRYLEYCTLNSCNAITERRFWMKFWSKFTPQQQNEMDARPTINDKRIRVIWGYKFREKDSLTVKTVKTDHILDMEKRSKSNIILPPTMLIGLDGLDGHEPNPDPFPEPDLRTEEEKHWEEEAKKYWEDKDKSIEELIMRLIPINPHPEPDIDTN